MDEQSVDFKSFAYHAKKLGSVKEERIPAEPSWKC